MDKVLRDKRKEFHAKLDFGESSRERRREDSYYSSARAQTTKPERLTLRDRLRYDDRHVLDRLGHRRQSAFDRLNDTYSPSKTKSRPRGTDSRDHPRGRSRPHKLDTSNEDCPKDRERFCGIRESYDDSFSHSYRDGNRSRHMKRIRDNESPLSIVTEKPWMCEEEDPFTPRIRNFESSHRTRMPNNVKTYNGTGDPEDHVKIFQEAAQVEWWTMPTWCHMFNSTLIGAARVCFDKLHPESIDSYKDLKEAFLAYFMQQKKYVKDPVEIHNIKQKDGETIEDFMKRFKVEIGGMNGAPECMRISEFMHGVNNPELTKRLNEHVPKTMEEMMITTTAFIRGVVVAASKKKGHTSWKAHDQSKRQTSEKRSDFWGHPKEGRGSHRFTPLQGRQKRFLRPRRIEELVRAGKLSHVIKEIKHGRDQSKTGKKETPAKDKPTAIYMVQSWQRMTRQKVTQSFEREKEIMFLPLTTSSGEEGPLVIEVEIGGHMIHRMYVDEGSLMEILYEHCFNRLRPEIKNQMVKATTSLTCFSGETIWPLGQLRLLVTIGDADHSTRAWMNFMIVRSLSPYNGIFGRPGIREIQAVPSTAHEMLKFPVEGGIVTIRSTILIPAECTSVITSLAVSKEEGIRPENSKVALHPDFPDQEVAIGGTLSAKGCTKLCSILKLRYIFMATIRHDRSYHQIQLAEPDEEKTDFHTGQGVYCYINMPFGLKNAGATYQWLVDKAFDSQIGRNIEVYVDDLVVKSYTEAEMLRDIDETFRTLRKINMKLNPKKCTFRATEGVFLGYVVTPEGIKSCPDKTAAVLQIPSPRTIKEVQSLNGKLASLNRFLSKSAQKSLPLFKTLKKCIKKSDFYWTTEAEQAFKQLKHHLSELPLLVAPKPKEELSIYLSATYGAISAFLMTERGATQMPIYFISRALQGLEQNYTPMEKLVLSLVFAAKRLQRYFQAHPITRRWDSKLVANQVLGTYVTKEENMIKYLDKVKSLVLVEILKEKSIKEKEVTTVVEGGQTDMDDTNSEAVIPYVVVKMGWIAPSRPLIPITATWPFYKWGIDIAGPFPEGPEIRMPTYRTATVDVVYNDEELRLNLDLLEERRERAAIREAKAKLKMAKYYKAWVRSVTFRPGDFVYRSNDASHAVAGGKLGPSGKDLTR
uniref:Reverse transcriptase domain-containing protein n=1 Tax=Tanacetum cinerariifolium TaxID=118510 RepID=A0A6L2LNV9_TANCI|nr:reverse transcriptase domain-containing protein [Tanacetum cinerariifolium]